MLSTEFVLCINVYGCCERELQAIHLRKMIIIHLKEVFPSLSHFAPLTNATSLNLALMKRDVHLVITFLQWRRSKFKYQHRFCKAQSTNATSQMMTQQHYDHKCIENKNISKISFFKMDVSLVKFCLFYTFGQL